MDSSSASLGPRPTDTVAKLFKKEEENRGGQYLGTTFSLGHPDYFVTAAHVLEGVEPDAIFLRGLFSGIGTEHPVHEDRPAEWVDKHPDADIGLLKIPESHWAPAEPFSQIEGSPPLGNPYYTFGYPLDVLGQEPTKEVGRLYRGHFQRFFSFRRFGYEYWAGELSTDCPRGLSGSPVFSNQGEVRVFGMVTKDEASYTRLHDREEDEEGTAIMDVLHGVTPGR